MTDWTEHEVPVSGGKLRVRVRGSGAPVLFLHGGLVNGHMWDNVVENLGSEIQAIVPDLPFGAHHLPMDPKADLSFAATASRLIEVLDHLGLEEVTVVANDTGGVGAQYLLVEHGHRVTAALLTSVDCYKNFPPKLYFWFPALMQVPGAAWLAAQLLRTRIGRGSPLTLGLLVRSLSKAEASLMMGPLWQNKASRRDMKRWARTLSKSQTVSLAKRFGTYAGPVHIAWTEKDRVFSPKYANRLAADFPGGLLVAPITNSKTLSPIDQPEQVAARVKGLIRALSQARV